VDVTLLKNQVKGVVGLKQRDVYAYGSEYYGQRNLLLLEIDFPHERLRLSSFLVLII